MKISPIIPVSAFIEEEGFTPPSPHSSTNSLRPLVIFLLKVIQVLIDIVVLGW